MNQEDIKYYPVPCASRYVVGTDMEVYRILKDGSRRKMKRQIYRRHGQGGDIQVGITYDDGKRRTLRPEPLILSLRASASRMRVAPQPYMYIPDLWGKYLVNHNGDVLEQKSDTEGVYFEPKHYYEDTSTNSQPLERINLRDQWFKQRTYTRTKLKQLVEERTQQVMADAEAYTEPANDRPLLMNQ